MPLTTLVDTATLADHLSDPGWAIVDCRFELRDPAWGEPDYAHSHIPGAVYAHLDRDLSGRVTGANGRHPLPEPAHLALTLSRLGIGNNTQVVAYDQNTGMYASRLWWMLRWVGHQAAAVLDGGFARWVAEGRPAVSGRATRPPAEFSAHPRPAMLVDANGVLALLNRAGTRLIDGRAPERFRGEVEPIDRAAGHIPGALNHFFEWNLHERGGFLPEEELRLRLEATLGDEILQNVVSYCGSGVTACHNLLALEHAGFRGARLYAGSWSEWSSDPARPVETG